MVRESLIPGYDPNLEEELDGDVDVDDKDDPYAQCFESIRSSTGLELGIKVNWPGLSTSISLSTRLPSDQIAPMFHGTQWAGTRIWRAAVVATEYLLSPQTPMSISESTSLLELGCGLGLPGMLLHALKGCRVVLTDMDSLVPQLSENLANNFSGSSTIEAYPLDWSRNGVKELLLQLSNGSFDVVLNCDCVYEPLYGDSWKYLAECQITLLEIKPDTLMITILERRKFDGVDKYLDVLQKSPWVSLVEKIEFDANDVPQIELYRIYGCCSPS